MKSRLVDTAITTYRTERAQIIARRAAETAEQDQLRGEWVRQELDRLSPIFTELFLGRLGLPAESDLGDDLHWYMPEQNLILATFQRGTAGIEIVADSYRSPTFLQVDIEALTVRADQDRTSEDENSLKLTVLNEDVSEADKNLVTLYQLGRLLEESRARLEEVAADQ